MTFLLTCVIIKPYMSICRTGRGSLHGLTKRRRYHWQEQVRKRIQPELLWLQGRRRRHKNHRALVLLDPVAVVRPELAVPMPKVREARAAVQAQEAATLEIAVRLPGLRRHLVARLHPAVGHPPDNRLPSLVLSMRAFWDRRSYFWYCLRCVSCCF